MALSAFSGGTDRKVIAEAEFHTWVSPNTMDSADYVTLPVITGKTPYIVACHDNTTGDQVTAVISTGIAATAVIIDAAGGTTNHEYVLTYIYK